MTEFLGVLILWVVVWVFVGRHVIRWIIRQAKHSK